MKRRSSAASWPRISSASGRCRAPPKLRKAIATFQRTSSLGSSAQRRRRGQGGLRMAAQKPIADGVGAQVLAHVLLAVGEQGLHQVQEGLGPLFSPLVACLPHGDGHPPPHIGGRMPRPGPDDSVEDAEVGYEEAAQRAVGRLADPPILVVGQAEKPCLDLICPQGPVVTKQAGCNGSRCRLRPLSQTAGPIVERFRPRTEGLLDGHHSLVAGLAPFGSHQGSDQALLVTGFEGA